MTRRTFYRRLKTITDKGMVWRKHSIRQFIENTNGQCPICAVQGDTYGLDFRKAAKKLGLSTYNAEEIAKAADNGYGHNSRVRGALLRACGLD